MNPTPTTCPHCCSSLFVESIDSEGVMELIFHCGTEICGGRSNRFSACYERQLAAIDSSLVKARERLDSAQLAMPAFHEGVFTKEHHDIDGNYIGSENIDPLSIVQVQGLAIDEALAIINKVLK